MNVSCLAGGHFGRAFLQAAFLAVDFDANRTYLAQAPGPGINGFVMEGFGGDNEEPEVLGDGLRASWDGHWTALSGEEDDGAGEVAGGGLSAEGIAGIVAGIVVTLGATLAAVVPWRRQRKTKTIGEDTGKPTTERS